MVQTRKIFLYLHQQRFGMTLLGVSMKRESGENPGQSSLL